MSLSKKDCLIRLKKLIKWFKKVIPNAKEKIELLEEVKTKLGIEKGV